MALLKLLLSDVETEISSGLLPHLSISCKFLALLHSVSILYKLKSMNISLIHKRIDGFVE